MSDWQQVLVTSALVLVLLAVIALIAGVICYVLPLRRHVRRLEKRQ